MKRFRHSLHWNRFSPETRKRTNDQKEIQNTDMITLTSMSPAMALQLIRSGESLATEEPVADKWSFARVPA
jgi:hypothetical protein